MMHRAVLVVDDDPFICRLITGYLEAEGRRATTVGDGQKAIELLASRAFDMVITDYNMPNMSGVELAQRMRSLKPSVPIALVSAALREVPEHELGIFDAVLEKPFEADELNTLVADALSNRDERLAHVTRPARYEVDWPVEYVPMTAEALLGKSPRPSRGVLRDISEHGLGLVADKAPPSDRFCALLIYPPGSSAPSLMVGEVRWTRDQAGKTRAGMKTMFWGSEREKAVAIERAM